MDKKFFAAAAGIKYLPAVAVLFSLTLFSCRKETSVAPKEPYEETVTLMFYGTGGGNLDCRQIRNIRQCASSGREDWLNMTFEYKFSEAYQKDSGYDKYHGVMRMDLEDADSLKGCIVYSAHPDTLDFNLKDLPLKKYSQDAGLDMGRDEELTAFISWSVKKHPADRYILVLSGCGDGWSVVGDGNARKKTKSILQDDNTLTSMSARSVLIGIRNSGIIPEILCTDACLAGAWENLAEWGGVAYHCACSLEPGSGIDCGLMLAAIKKDRGYWNRAFRNYIDTFLTEQEKAGCYADMGIYDLSKIPVIAPVVDSVAKTFIYNLYEASPLPEYTCRAIRGGLMSGWTYVRTPVSVATEIARFYNTPVTWSKDGQSACVESRYVTLLRKNHKDIWSALPASDTTKAITQLGELNIYGESLGDVLKKYSSTFGGQIPASLAPHKKNADKLLSDYVAAVKSVAYIGCTFKTYEDQAYVEASPSINVMALNEEGWKPWKGDVYEENSIRLANDYELKEVIDAYHSSIFATLTNWLEFLETNRVNPCILSNDSRLTRYSGQ